MVVSFCKNNANRFIQSNACKIQKSRACRQIQNKWTLWVLLVVRYIYYIIAPLANKYWLKQIRLWNIGSLLSSVCLLREKEEEINSSLCLNSLWIAHILGWNRISQIKTQQYNAKILERYELDICCKTLENCSII